jgi:hypothetical protein
MTNKKPLVLFILTILTLNFLVIPTLSTDWWNTSFQYRKPINISNTVGDLTNYQVKINLTEAVYNSSNLVGSWHFNRDSGDRVVDSSGEGFDGYIPLSDGNLTNMESGDLIVWSKL